MKLRALRLHGFKSFADRTEIRFHDGLTAIVGPNGCGKSNISDAVRWVLGEQKASAIRSSRMDDAIFQGTAQRRRVNRAEVELVVSNESGVLPVPYKEVEIRRTVFRDGGSEYAMNRNPVRLKDIVDAYRDTGLGANAYAIIEQGMIDSILSERAEDRRHMFEEAAGIGRYKDRRKAAQRRLEHAQSDLDRLQDLIGEVESKVRSLARQKGRAQRYLTLRERRLGLEIALADAELSAVEQEMGELDQRLEQLRGDAPALKAELSSVEADLEQRRIAAAEAVRARNQLAARSEELGRRISEGERRIAVAMERSTHAERRLKQIEVERQRQRERVTSRHEELEELSDLERLVGESLDELRERYDQVARRVEQLKGALDEARRGEADRAAAEEDAAREVHRLEGLAQAAEARAAGAAARLDRLVDERAQLETQRSDLDEQRDLFAERQRELEQRIRDAEQARDAQQHEIDRLRDELSDAGRALVEAEDRANSLASEVALLERRMREYSAFAPAVAAAMRSEALQGVRGPLADHLTLPDERAAALEAALGSLLQVLVVEDEEAVEELGRWLERQDDVEGVLALLPERDLDDARVLLEALRVAGRPNAAPALVGREQRLQRLREQAARAADERRERLEQRDALAARLEQAGDAQRERERELHEREIELRRAAADESARSERRERLERLESEFDAEEANLERVVSEAQDEVRETRARADELREHLEAAREERRAVVHTVEQRRAEWEAAREEQSEDRVVRTRAEAELEAIDRRRDAAANALAEAESRLVEMDREEAEQRETLETAASERSASESELERQFRERDELSETLRSLDEKASATTEAMESLEQRARELRSRVDRGGEDRHRLELRRADLAGAERRIRERLEAEWSKPLEQLRREATAPEEVEQGVGLEPLRSALTEVTASIERLGMVNMLAVEEHEEESKRLEFLDGQRQDLESARDDLQAAIRRINKAARDLFMDTFEQIRHHFQSTFQTLFEGGECDLWLADPEDPLESPIEISASPRGKRTQRIHLLSGGERALTALALLFAIYLVKPSPFCVLDEVDAPLDEANIGRFVAMLRQFKADTQFVVITHNPRTMEAADWIYGVTMEEAGVSNIVGVELQEMLEPEPAPV